MSTTRGTVIRGTNILASYQRSSLRKTCLHDSGIIYVCKLHTVLQGKYTLIEESVLEDIQIICDAFINATCNKIIGILFTTTYIT